jgi:hypothetical protein
LVALREEFVKEENMRQAVNTAQNAATTAGTTAAGYGSAATGIGGTLSPILTKEATNPTGLTPTEKNTALVAGEQGAGGATGSVAGAAGLQANRSRNTGALSSVLDAAARAKSQQFSRGAEGVANEDTMLKESNRQAGIRGLQGLYGTNVSAQLGSAGQVGQDVNAEVNANNSGWLQNTLNTVNTITGGAKNVAGAMYGGNSGFANS